MSYRLDHMALNCNNLDESGQYDEKILGGTPTAERKAGDGKRFRSFELCGSAPIKLIESANESCINHFGVATDVMDQSVAELTAKNAEFIGEIRDKAGKRTVRAKLQRPGWKCACRAQAPAGAQQRT